MHQDAHEFLNYILNAISEILDKQASTLAQLARPGSAKTKTEPSWIQVLFEGSLTNQTKCRTCETVRMFCKLQSSLLRSLSSLQSS
jgi:ubiquitin carboxyl-terminal hydrolase 12/46